MLLRADRLLASLCAAAFICFFVFTTDSRCVGASLIVGSSRLVSAVKHCFSVSMMRPASTVLNR